MGSMEWRVATAAAAQRHRTGRLESSPCAAAFQGTNETMAAGRAAGPRSARDRRCRHALVAHKRPARDHSPASHDRTPVVFGSFTGEPGPICVDSKRSGPSPGGYRPVAEPGGAGASQEWRAEHPIRHCASDQHRPPAPDPAALVPSTHARRVAAGHPHHPL